MTPAQIESILKQQHIDWDNALKFGRGNPFATLCMCCYGRHPPPRDNICPRTIVRENPPQRLAKSLSDPLK